MVGHGDSPGAPRALIDIGESTRTATPADPCLHVLQPQPHLPLQPWSPHRCMHKLLGARARIVSIANLITMETEQTRALHMLTPASIFSRMTMKWGSWVSSDSSSRSASCKQQQQHTADTCLLSTLTLNKAALLVHQVPLAPLNTAYATV
jgi:hypothetical protein